MLFGNDHSTALFQLKKLGFAKHPLAKHIHGNIGTEASQRSTTGSYTN